MELMLTCPLQNPNHRHDEKHEQETDDKRSRISQSHRFGSFAPEREGNNIKWYVDGRDYFWVRVTVLGPSGCSSVLTNFRLSR